MLVVGAGFAGSVCARRMAEEFGLRVLVIDRRPHLAGNAHDALDDHGVLIHTYGPHIFHTNAAKVTDFLSRFTDWHPYEHRVWAAVDGRIVPMPINRTTIQALHSVELHDDEDTAAYLASLAEPRAELKNSEDAVVAKVGRDLYERLFRGYTRKQWSLDPSELHASVCARLPVRTNEDDRYFGDSFQKMPAAGFTAMFERMLDHPNIELALGTEYDDIRDEVTPASSCGPARSTNSSATGWVRSRTGASSSSAKPAPLPAAGSSSRSRSSIIQTSGSPTRA